MGLKFLDGKGWSEVTREERFFTLQLYSCVLDDGADRFVNYLNRTRNLDFNEGSDWEIAYEVCLYRDIWHYRGKKGRPFSPKRTFDLCLLSDDEIVIIEAKAQQNFDQNQLGHFKKDCEAVKAETEVGRVDLLGLASSKCRITSSVSDCFDAPILTWLELARLYNNDPILLRADSIYESSGWESSGKHNEGGYMTGVELMAAFENGERFYVGRGGGLKGGRLENDVKSGGWKTQKYETNRTADAPPGSNWFSLGDFVFLVRTRGK
ncbi:MAG: hypothetical protein ACYS8W_02900 [Planctomycetota bacterium]